MWFLGFPILRVSEVFGFGRMFRRFWMIFSLVLRFLISYTPMPPSVSNEEHSMMSSDWLRVALLLHALWQYIQGIIYMTFLVPPYRTLFVRKSGNDRCHLPVGTVLLSVRLYSYFFSFVRFKYLSCLGISTLPTFVAIFAYFYLAIQSNPDYPDLDYPDFSIIRTFSLVPIWL